LEVWWHVREIVKDHKHFDHSLVRIEQSLAREKNKISDAEMNHRTERETVKFASHAMHGGKLFIPTEWFLSLARGNLSFVTLEHPTKYNPVRISKYKKIYYLSTPCMHV
jgi:hypothetical protein